MVKELDAIERVIWSNFRVKHKDTLPFKGWAGTRDTLAQTMGQLGFKTGAEIGVCKGEYSEVLLRAISGLKIYCVDPWVAYNRIDQDLADARYEECIARLSIYSGVNIIKKPSVEAAAGFPDGSLDFVYIDGLHEFDAVMLDLLYWAPKVKVGGIIAGHDYCEFYQAGVIAAVRAYTQAHNIHKWYVTRDREPSFFWVKADDYI